MQQRSVTRDGWYANLPELRNCRESTITGVEVASYAMLRPAVDAPMRLQFKGKVPPILGTAVNETRTTDYDNGNITVDTTELVELSRTPVDPRLFEVPKATVRRCTHLTAAAT